MKINHIFGRTFIDVPISNQTYIKPDNNELSVSGWAVSDDSNANLQLLIDGQIIKASFNRTVRSDIDKLISPEFGGVSSNPKPGFQTTVNISNYSAGQHILKVREISRNKELLYESEVTFKIENKKYVGRVFIDNPKQNQSYIRPDNQNIVLQGWAVANDSSAKLQVFVDGNNINSNIERFVREDIDNLISNQFGGVKDTPKAGFQTIIDISNFSAGQHTLKVREISRNGDILAVHENMFMIQNKKFDGNMFIDSPNDNQSFIRPDVKSVILSGWAVSSDSNSYLNVLIDGKKTSSTVKRFLREDVDKLISPKYGGNTVTPQAGFQANVNISNLDKGMHKINVQEISRYGELIVETEKNIIIENKKYSR